MKPMLAVDHNPKKLVYPCYASPKLDGLRGLVHEGKLLSRSLKPIPNLQVSKTLSQSIFEGFDGELIAGSPTAPNAMQEATSLFMAHHQRADFTFYVFDLHNHEGGYDVRYAALAKRVKALKSPNIVLHERQLIVGEDELLAYETECLAAGYEGLILRKIDGAYKYGRSTVNEGYLLKVKRFSDSEAVIIGFEEQMHNGNEAITNELGRTKRSSHQENKWGKGTLGALVVKDIRSGVEFNIGTGMNDGVRAHIWVNRETVIGDIVKYKFFSIGVKTAPRHPVFIGFRDRRDL